jgi:hypothetical protein
MLNRKKIPIVVLVALNVALGAAFLPASAQTGSVEGSAQSQISYKTAYPEVNAGADSSVTVQSEHHLYRPGDTVMITGSVSSEMREETDSDTVTVRLMDVEGAAVAEQQVQVDGNGEYSASLELPADAEGGYSAGSKLEVEASVLGLLDAELVARLESSTAFAVASSSSFDIAVEEDEFQVEIASNSTVDGVELDPEAKMVKFRVEGDTGTKGVTQVTIPKAMLSGEMTVMIDGQVVSSESNDVIVTSDTDVETTFEINYSHSEHDVAVSGTNVAPEFPIATFVMAGAVGSIIAALAIAKKKGFGI